ncbi:hypothetical protein BC629DRAFT_1473194 [Irpex lacteus]|nr:hypothetical protein BC629DRAFT_1473194 [Irpex lacteus]
MMYETIDYHEKSRRTQTYLMGSPLCLHLFRQNAQLRVRLPVQVRHRICQGRMP